jgi:hypothetical protein
MIGRMMVVLAAAATLSCVSVAAPARAADETRPPDLNGQWRLDPKHSDAPMAPGGQGGPGGAMRGGRGGFGGGPGGFGGGPGGFGGGPGGPGGGGFGRGGRGGPGGGPPQGEAQAGGTGGESRRGARPARLPELFHVTQTDDLVSFEDSTGTVLQEITTIGAAKDTLAHAPGAQVVAGAWEGGKLVVHREGMRGMKVTETISYDEKNQWLVVQVRMEGSSGGEGGQSMPAREFKRVYARAKD